MRVEFTRLYFIPFPLTFFFLGEILYTNLRVTDEAYRSIPVYIKYDWATPKPLFCNLACLPLAIVGVGIAGCTWCSVLLRPALRSGLIGSVFFAPAEVSKTNPAWHVFTLSFVPIQYPKLFRKNVEFVHGKHGSCAKARSPSEKLWQMLLESHLRQRMWNVQVAI